MLVNPMLKQELHIKLEQLSTTKLQEVLDFVSFLLSQQANAQSEASTIVETVPPNHDPLQAFVGAISHGALAQEIDEEVYGT